MQNRSKYHYDDDLVEDVINKYGHFPSDYEHWTFIYFHITTSANKCASFRKYGILDLKNSYLNVESELRAFLDSKGVFIDIECCTLNYRNRTFDISFGKCPSQADKEAYACWCIGRKFYYDYTTCGFLSIWDQSPYGGYVHCRPEILSDIDRLLGLTLSNEWYLKHKPYEIVATVPGTDIVYDGNDDRSSKEKVLDYLTRAYTTAFGWPREDIVLLKNNVQVPPNRIIEINPLGYW